jgi:hypothetical protein
MFSVIFYTKLAYIRRLVHCLLISYNVWNYQVIMDVKWLIGIRLKWSVGYYPPLQQSFEYLLHFLVATSVISRDIRGKLAKQSNSLHQYKYDILTEVTKIVIFWWVTMLFLTFLWLVQKQPCSAISSLTTKMKFHLLLFTLRWCPNGRRGGLRKCAILWRHRGHGQNKCVSSVEWRW